MTDEVVTRLYRALVAELRRREHPEDRPVTVADIHQTLIPYSAVRSSIGVELNADYEHALLRLLAGERDLLRLEPRTAREELRREVEEPYPSVGLYREFSASNVWVTMPDAPERKEPPPAAETKQRAAPPTDTKESEAPAADARRSPTPAPAETARIRTGGAEPAPEPPAIRLHPSPGSRPDEGARPAERVLHLPAACAFCGEDLPAGRRVRFCPYCGGDQRLRPCPRCEAVLERDWRHCISCGSEVGAS